jgi:hypothetical protein
MYEGAEQNLFGPCTATTNIYSACIKLYIIIWSWWRCNLKHTINTRIIFLAQRPYNSGKSTYFIVDYFQIWIAASLDMLTLYISSAVESIIKNKLVHIHFFCWPRKGLPGCWMFNIVVKNIATWPYSVAVQLLWFNKCCLVRRSERHPKFIETRMSSA